MKEKTHCPKASIGLKRAQSRKPNILPAPPRTKEASDYGSYPYENKRIGTIPRTSRSNPRQRVSLHNPSKVKSPPLLRRETRGRTRLSLWERTRMGIRLETQ